MSTRSVSRRDRTHGDGDLNRAVTDDLPLRVPIEYAGSGPSIDGSQVGIS